MTCLICLVSVIICIFNCEKNGNIRTGHLRIVLVFAIFTIGPLILECLLGNNRVTMAILQKFLENFS